MAEFRNTQTVLETVADDSEATLRITQTVLETAVRAATPTVMQTTQCFREVLCTVAEGVEPEPEPEPEPPDEEPTPEEEAESCPCIPEEDWEQECNACND